MNISEGTVKLLNLSIYNINNLVRLLPNMEYDHKLLQLRPLDYDQTFRMRQAWITGEFDHKKEIQVPSKLNGKDGYDIYTPFYYYNIILPTNGEDPIVKQNMPKDYVLKGGMAVHRGWVPNLLKDRRTRPYDVNTGVTTLKGTLKYTGLNIHNFRIPNNAYKGVWENVCLEDFARYWNLPNVDEASSAYFQELSIDNSNEYDIYPQKKTITDLTFENAVEENCSSLKNLDLLTYASAAVGSTFSFICYVAGAL